MEALRVADFFIWKDSQQNNPDLTNMKLQKLLYFAQGFYLIDHPDVLIDENIEAWKFGPVIPSVYHFFKSSKDNIVLLQRGNILKDQITGLTTEIEESLSETWEILKDIGAIHLSNITHADNSPWSEIVAKRGGVKNLNHDVIPIESIRRFFIENYTQK
jgi:uncharacterized phage-associated protein